MYSINIHYTGMKKVINGVTEKQLEAFKLWLDGDKPCFTFNNPEIRSNLIILKKNIHYIEIQIEPQGSATFQSR